MRLLAAAALAALLLAAPARARAQTALVPLVPAAGRIESGGAQSWTFTAAEGSVWSLLVQAAPGGLDPLLSLSTSAGDPLLANDDLAYPDARDSLLEAVTLPRSDTYTVTVSGYAATAGDYTLTLLPGYSQVAFTDNFNGDLAWQSAHGPVRPSIEDGALQLLLPQPEETGIAANPANRPPPVFYAQVALAVGDEYPAWSVGMTARQVGSNGYYLFTINETGAWRFLVNDRGTERVLRDWATHPAIIAGQKAFTLAILANGGSFDLFYNTQLLGHVDDTTFPEGGGVGLALQTGAVRSPRLAARYEDFLVTTPLLINGSPALPQQVIVGTPASMAQELQRRLVVPPGGEMALTVQDSFVEFARPGVERLLLGRGATFREFALGTQVTWQAAASAMTGCGLVFHNTGETAYTLAYLDQTGGYGVSRRQGETFLPGLFGQKPPGGKNTYHLLVVARDDRVLYYVDGLHAGTLELAPVEGQVGGAVVNFEPVNTSCRFANTWLWRWD